MRKLSIIILVLISLFIISCDNSSKIVTDVHGYKYRLVEKSKIVSSNITTTELWELIEPLDTNNWYYLSLGSRIYTNYTPIFNRLLR